MIENESCRCVGVVHCKKTSLQTLYSDLFIVLYEAVDQQLHNNNTHQELYNMYFAINYPICCYLKWYGRLYSILQNDIREKLHSNKYPLYKPNNDVLIDYTYNDIDYTYNDIDYTYNDIDYKSQDSVIKSQDSVKDRNWESIIPFLKNGNNGNVKVSGFVIDTKKVNSTNFILISPVTLSDKNDFKQTFDHVWFFSETTTRMVANKRIYFSSFITFEAMLSSYKSKKYNGPNNLKWSLINPQKLYIF